jgi:hypothetical protein
LNKEELQERKIEQESREMEGSMNVDEEMEGLKGLKGSMNVDEEKVILTNPNEKAEKTRKTRTTRTTRKMRRMRKTRKMRKMRKMRRTTRKPSRHLSVLWVVN